MLSPGKRQATSGLRDSRVILPRFPLPGLTAVTRCPDDLDSAVVLAHHVAGQIVATEMRARESSIGAGWRNRRERGEGVGEHR